MQDSFEWPCKQPALPASLPGCRCFLQEMDSRGVSKLQAKIEKPANSGG